MKYYTTKHPNQDQAPYHRTLINLSGMILILSVLNAGEEPYQGSAEWAPAAGRAHSGTNSQVIIDSVHSSIGAAGRAHSIAGYHTLYHTLNPWIPSRAHTITRIQAVSLGC